MQVELIRSAVGKKEATSEKRKTTDDAERTEVRIVLRSVRGGIRLNLVFDFEHPAVGSLDFDRRAMEYHFESLSFLRRILRIDRS